jgi:sugar O-acyltransferase (sialic acid O-acetyltransferase NeuD family)
MGNEGIMSKVIVFGTGDIGQLAHFYLTHDSPHDVVAFCADQEFITDREMLGLPIVAFEEVLDEYPPDSFDMFVALSYAKLNQTRAQKYYEAKQKGYTLVSYITTHYPRWPDTEFGDNCFILENQTIQPFVKIGNNVTLWSGNHIGHHSVVGDHCFLANVVVSGHCTIGEFSFMGTNSEIRDGITLAPGTVLGAGGTLVKDTVDNGVYVGVAAELKSVDGAKLNYFANTSYTNR